MFAINPSILYKSLKMIKFALFLLFGLVFVEGQSETPGISCERDEFSCFNGQCVPRGQWCDKNRNCKDGTDEIFCNKRGRKNEDPNNCKPQKWLFLCQDGICIPSNGRCDGTYECPDKSDESNCTSKANAHTETAGHQNQKLQLSSYTEESSFYRDLPYRSYRSQLNLARDWLKSMQRKDYGWGDSTARAVISMYLSREDTFTKTDEELLMDKQLDIELFIALTRNETSTMSLSELALYINSLLAACKNPRNFYGYDLVNILRDRANKVYSTIKFVSPLVQLTLCLSNSTEHIDVQSLQAITRINQNVLNKVDILSLAVLTSSCIMKNEIYRHPKFRANFVNALLDKLKRSGLPGNIYELSLAMQALNEAKADPRDWERDDAIEFILKMQDGNGSFGDILATYYTIPVLSGKSLLFLSNHCGKDFSNGQTPLAVLKNAKKSKISVQYSLLFGDPVEMSQKVQLLVAEGTNFLDVMRLAEEENPNFRFNLDETKQVPFVYSIGGIPNDAERGLYWTLHWRNPHNVNNQIRQEFIPYGNDIKGLIPRNGEEIRFWLKQM